MSNQNDTKTNLEDQTLRVDGGSVRGSGINAKLSVTLRFDDQLTESEARDVLVDLIGEMVTIDETERNTLD